MNCSSLADAGIGSDIFHVSRVADFLDRSPTMAGRK